MMTAHSLRLVICGLLTIAASAAVHHASPAAAGQTPALSSNRDLLGSWGNIETVRTFLPDGTYAWRNRNAGISLSGGYSTQGNTVTLQTPRGSLACQFSAGEDALLGALGRLSRVLTIDCGGGAERLLFQDDNARRSGPDGRDFTNVVATSATGELWETSNWRSTLEFAGNRFRFHALTSRHGDAPDDVWRLEGTFRLSVLASPGPRDPADPHWSHVLELQPDRSDVSANSADGMKESVAIAGGPGDSPRTFLAANERGHLVLRRSDLKWPKEWKLTRVK